jgi:hypothetical protein
MGIRALPRYLQQSLERSAVKSSVVHLLDQTVVLSEVPQRDHALHSATCPHDGADAAGGWPSKATRIAKWLGVWAACRVLRERGGGATSFAVRRVVTSDARRRWSRRCVPPDGQRFGEPYQQIARLCSAG